MSAVLEISITADGKMAVREVNRTTAAVDEADKATKKTKQTNQEARTELERFMAAHRKQAETLGMTASQTKVYEAARLGATAADLRAIEVNNRLIESYEASQKSLGKMNPLVEVLTGKLAALISIGAGFTIAKHLIETSDGFTLLAARISLVTANMYQQQQVQQQLYQVAQQLQVPYQELAGQFPRISRSIREYGGSTADAIAVTRIFAQTVKISGATQEEAASSALQFAQALASGRLGGDELRSVLENNSLLAQYLAAGLKVSIGQLRAMGEEGKLTSEKIVQALLSQQGAIDQQAKQIPTTVAGSWTALTNALQHGVTQSGEMGLAMRLLKGYIDLTTESLEKNARAEVARQRAYRGETGAPTWNRAEDARFARQDEAADQRDKAGSAAQRAFDEQMKGANSATAVNLKYNESLRAMSVAYGALVTTGKASAVAETQFKEAVAANERDRRAALEGISKKGQASMQAEVALSKARTDQLINQDQSYFQQKQEGYSRELKAEEYYHQAGMTTEKQYIDQRARIETSAAQDRLAQIQLELGRREQAFEQLKNRPVRGADEDTQKRTDIAQAEKQITDLKDKERQATQALSDVEVNRGRAADLAEKKIQDTIKVTKRMVEDYSTALDRQVEEIEHSTRMIGLDEQAQAKANATRQLTIGFLEKQKQLERQIEDARANGKDPKEIAALEKALQELATKTGQSMAKVNAALDNQYAVKNVVSAWQDGAQQIGNLIGDIVTDWQHAGATILSFAKQMWRQLISMWAQKLILNLGANLVGGQAGSGLASTASSIGQGTLTGAVGNAMSSWLGSTAAGVALKGAFEGVQMGYMSGVAAPGATMEAFGAMLAKIMPYLGWFAVAVAAAAESAHLYAEGWDTNGLPSYGVNGNPLTNPLAFVPDTKYRALKALGINEKWAQIMSGSPIIDRLIGHRAQQNDAMGIRGTVTNSGVTGTNWQDWSQAGGLFTHDIRGSYDSSNTPGMAFNAEQQALFAQFMAPVASIVNRLADRIGVNPTSALTGYTHSFDMQLNNNGKPLSTDEVNALLEEMFTKVLQEQVTRILDEGGKSALAEYVRNLKGSAAEIQQTIANIMGVMDQLHSIDQVIAVITGDFASLIKEQMGALDQAVADGKEKFNAALASQDPTKILAAEDELMQAVTNRYNTEIQMVRDLQSAIDELQDQAYQFSIQMAQKIVSLGGTRDIAGMSMNRATSLTGAITTGSNYARQGTALQRYVSAIDTWYSARRDAIMKDAAAQAAAGQAFAQAQSAAAQTRIDQLSKELDFAKAMAGVVEQAQKTILDMKLSGSNPLALSGRVDLAHSRVEDLKALYLSSTGDQKVLYAQQLLEAINTWRDLEQQLNQRPSAEHQAAYNEMMADLTNLQSDAKTAADKQVEIETSILQLQQQQAAYQQQAANAAQGSNDALDALNQEALPYYEWAENEGQRIFEAQERQHQEQLDAITGGQDVELFIADRQKDAVAELKSIRELLEQYLNGTVTGNNGSGTGSGTGDNNSGNKTEPPAPVVVHQDIYLDGKVLASALMPAIDTRITQRATSIARAKV